MFEFNPLNPEDFEPPFNRFTKSLLYDYCKFFNISARLDKSSDICEFKLKNELLTTAIQKGQPTDVFPKNYGDQNDYRQLLAVDWKYLAQNKSKKLFITCRLPVIFSNFVKPLNKIIKKYDLFKRVFWVGTNPLELNFQSSCYFKILHLNPWTNGVAEAAIKARSSDAQCNIQQSPIGDASCHFVSLCARKKFYRSLGTFLFYKKNLHKKGMYSYIGSEAESKYEKQEVLKREVELTDRGIPFDEFYNFISTHNNALDFEEQFLYKVGFNNGNQILLGGASCDLNKKGLINLIHESTAGNKEIYMTEKTMHSFFVGRPFLLLGNPNTLKYLRDEWGFKTFDFLFDESYDKEVDQISRVQKVIQQLELFCSKSFDYQKQIIREHQHILDHNHRVASTFPHKEAFLKVLGKINV